MNFQLSVRLLPIGFLAFSLSLTGCTAVFESMQRLSETVKPPVEDSFSFSVTLASGKTYVNSPQIDFSISGEKTISEYVIASTATECENSQLWLPLQDSNPKELTHLNDKNELFFKVKSTDGKTSGCVKKEIYVDITPPDPPSGYTLPTNNTNRSDINIPPSFSFLPSQDSLSGISHYEFRILNAYDNSEVLTWAPYTLGTPLPTANSLTTAPGMAYYAEVRAVDLAGNISSPIQTDSWSEKMTTHVINKDVPFALGVSSAFSYLDLNNDGHPDIRFNGVNKSIFYINNLLGGFTQYTVNNLDGCSQPMMDFNKDGYLDCLGNQYIYFGGKDFVFSKVPHDIPYLTSTNNITIYDDVDNDGDPDVFFISGAVVTLYKYTLLGFEKQNLFTMESPLKAYMAQLQDMNNDGIKDLVIRHNQLDISWYNMDPTTNYQKNTISTSYIYFLCKDLDGLNGTDLILYNSNDLEVWLNSGDGINFSKTSLISGATALSAILHDFDHDEDLDLLTSSNSEARLYLNDATGTFALHSSNPSLAGGIKDIIDVDADGYDDLVSQTDPKYASGTGAADINSFSGWLKTTELIPGDYSIGEILGGTSADVDKDGDMDIIALQYTGIDLLLNNGTGSFTKYRISNLQAFDVEVIDFDSDGDNDLVVSGREDQVLYLLRNNGNLVFTSTSLTTGVNIYESNSFKVADIDQNGKMDFVVSKGDYYSSDVWVYLDNGGAFPSFSGTEIFSNRVDITGVDAADLDGANNLDIIVTDGNDPSHVTLLANNGSQIFTPTTLHSNASRTMSALRVLDYDKDGDLDILYIQEFGAVKWIENQGAHSYVDRPESFGYGSWAGKQEWLDIDGDGDLDLLLYDNELSGYANLMIGYNQGDNITFVPKVLDNSICEHPSIFNFADINGDGKPDIVVGGGSYNCTGLKGAFSNRITWREISTAP